MKTILETAKRTDTGVEHEISTVLFTVVSASALLLGIWAGACLIGAVLDHGLLTLLRGYLTAVTGY